MKHRANPRFWSFYDQLEPEIRQLADKNFKLLLRDPHHPSRRLKRVGRVGSPRRGQNQPGGAPPPAHAVGWLWIGSHAEYDRLLG